jgi:hypothetical protein
LVSLNESTATRSRRTSNGLTVNKTSHHFGNERLRMCGWRLAVMGMMTLVVAFTVAVTLPLRPIVSSTSPIAVAMITENDRNLPTDRPDYGLMEHGIHCLGHAVLRNAVAMSEPFRIHNSAYYLTDEAAIASSNLSPPEKPPRV